MRYYFAGAYARRAELAGRAMELEMAVPTAKVTSSWLADPQEGHDAGFSVGGMTTPEQIELAWSYGQQDIADLLRSDAIVSFTGEGARGGRHVEHGFAMAFLGDQPMGSKSEWPMRLIVVGPREHVFHCHPATEVYPDFDAFLAHEITHYGPTGTARSA